LGELRFKVLRKSTLKPASCRESSLFKSQPGPESDDHHQDFDSKDHDPQWLRAGTLEGRVGEHSAEHRRDEIKVDRNVRLAEIPNTIRSHLIVLAMKALMALIDPIPHHTRLDVDGV
jgi:hypothetical protein